MKLKKIIAGVALSAVAASSLAVVASANDAFLMFADSSWLWGVWSTADFPAGNADVTGDGTYTVFVDNTASGAQVEDEETGDLVPTAASGTVVFNVDIDDLGTECGFGKGCDEYVDNMTPADKMALAKAKGVNVTDLKITTYSEDGSSVDIPVDVSKLIFGDIEGNGKLRIEIYNEYGETKNDPPIDPTSLAFDEKIAVTFTVTGIDAARGGADDAEVVVISAGDVDAATESSKGSPDTGVADVAAVAGIAVVAAGAFMVSRKRK